MNFKKHMSNIKCFSMAFGRLKLVSLPNMIRSNTSETFEVTANQVSYIFRLFLKFLRKYLFY